MKSALLAYLLCLLVCRDVRAIIVYHKSETEIGVKKSISTRPPAQTGAAQVPDFCYWDHVGMVGMGSGVYLGDGYVLTSAHVGCHPFRMGDGSNYKPDYASWRILSDEGGGKSDLAVFRVEIWDTESGLASLGRLPIGHLEAGSKKNLVMIGTGFVQRPKAVSHEKYNVVLGYETQRQREKRWGANFLDKVLETPVTTTGGYRTHCFVSTFDRSEGEAQASEGDSGGAMFSYDSERGQWELVGCIVAVSQLGTYVPFGSRTYVGNLSAYESQLPHAPVPAVNTLTQTSSATSQSEETEQNQDGDAVEQSAVIPAITAIADD